MSVGVQIVVSVVTIVSVGVEIVVSVVTIVSVGVQIVVSVVNECRCTDCSECSE